MTEPIQIELPTIFEAMTVNAWLIKGKENVLIDCGEKTDKSWDALINGLRTHGLELKDIPKVVITHGHLDHIGMAGKITEHSDATIWVSEYVYDWAVNLKEMLERRSRAVLQGFESNLPDEYIAYYQEFGYNALSPYWDEIPKDRIHVFPMSGAIDLAGQEWEILYTPGHCINQTCFYQKATGRLLSADMLLKMTPLPITDAALTAPFDRVPCLIMQLESYQKLAKLDIQKAYPGHLAAFENVAQLIETQVKRIYQRKETCFQLIQSGIVQFMDLLESIYPNRIIPPTIFMVIGLLDLLLDEGRIEGFLVNGKLQYQVKIEKEQLKSPKSLLA